MRETQSAYRRVKLPDTIRLLWDDQTITPVWWYHSSKLLLIGWTSRSLVPGKLSSPTSQLPAPILSSSARALIYYDFPTALPPPTALENRKECSKVCLQTFRRETGWPRNPQEADSLFAGRCALWGEIREPLAFFQKNPVGQQNPSSSSQSNSSTAYQASDRGEAETLPSGNSPRPLPTQLSLKIFSKIIGVYMKPASKQVVEKKQSLVAFLKKKL